MNPERLTREQAREQTRQRLLDASQIVFTKKGFVAGSVEEIVLAAGYTRGAFYSNFRSKQELLIELLKRDHLAMQAGLHDIMQGQVAREDLEDRALLFYSHLYRDNKNFLLWVEAQLLASRDIHFRVIFNAFLHEKLEHLTAYIREFSVRAGTPLPAETLALGLMALCNGVRFFYSINPEHVTAELVESVLAQFFSRVVFGRGIAVIERSAPVGLAGE
ncbi:TetR/AcrR family transcriptional regulator [Burkholderia sp. S171]|uniref:TetR/AcrR family transcriptional regulator n=1 Tax=Burkholderia sp. S171 TaxID=1641860 RepID=UPI00131A72A5|nr:TetR/AcrR family transcriptional regulator [Burkholderia sp. S171]